MARHILPQACVALLCCARLPPLLVLMRQRGAAPAPGCRLRTIAARWQQEGLDGPQRPLHLGLQKHLPLLLSLYLSLQRVTLERRLPYDIAPGQSSAQFYARPDTVHDSGVEGLVFSFQWELYAGHHLVSPPGR